MDYLVRPLQEAIARTISLAVAAVGLIVTAPLIVIVAALIKLDSPGPALFIQERIGLYGRRFKLLKFRTMIQAKETTSEWVSDNVDRITRVGQWARKFRLDELPQFVNILRGDMNLVGPRPHPVSNYRVFIGSIPYYGLRRLCGPASPVGRRFATATPTTSRKRPRRCGTTCTTSRTARYGSTCGILSTP